jgi:hypothetical protein
MPDNRQCPVLDTQSATSLYLSCQTIRGSELQPTGLHEYECGFYCVDISMASCSRHYIALWWPSLQVIELV